MKAHHVSPTLARARASSVKAWENYESLAEIEFRYPGSEVDHELLDEHRNFAVLLDTHASRIYDIENAPGYMSLGDKIEARCLEIEAEDERRTLEDART